MLVINRNFVEQWAREYDIRFDEGHAKTEEDVVRHWLSTISEPKY